VPPWITSQPVSITVTQGVTTNFSVTAIGTSNLVYRWFTFGTNALPYQTNSTLTLTNIQSSDAAGYSVLVTNSAGTNMSLTAWLSVTTGGTTTNGWGGTGGTNAPNSAPFVTMTSPTNSASTNPAVFLYGSPISIRASATSKYSYITNVAFYLSTDLGTNFTAATNTVPGPNSVFALAWTNSVPGTNVLKARAWDYTGATADSAPVYVVMAMQPAISAGPDTTLVWTEGAASTNITLNGSISSNGVPSSGPITIQWSVASGNAQFVTITNPASLTSPVTFSTNDVFRLQLRVDNSLETSTSICTVNIRRRPVVHFNSPTNYSAFLPGVPIVLNATATPYNPQSSPIAGVGFYDGTNLISA